MSHRKAYEIRELLGNQVLIQTHEHVWLPASYFVPQFKFLRISQVLDSFVAHLCVTKAIWLQVSL